LAPGRLARLIEGDFVELDAALAALVGYCRIG
jgi:hypothetical protein